MDVMPNLADLRRKIVETPKPSGERQRSNADDFPLQAIASKTRQNRRRFLQSMGGGLLVLFTLDEQGSAQESGGPRGRHRGGEALPQNVSAWLHIDNDGGITVFTGKAEVGQNIRTSLSQAVADELRIEPATIRLVMGDTALTPFDFGTVGSRTTPGMAPQLRKISATMREKLVSIAADKWSADHKSLSVSGGCVLQSTSGRKASFGELARNVDWLNVIGQDDLTTPASNWQYGGKSLPKVNAQEFVTGKHKYTSDLTRPGMLYGRVLRAPSFDAKLLSADTSAASGMRSVTVVHDGDFVGVAAPDEFIAHRAIEAIKAKWREQPQISTNELFSYLKANPSEDDQKPETSAEAGTAAVSSGKKLQSTYTVAYIAHVPLEPRAAVAEWKGPRLTVWTGSQRPFGVRSELAKAFQLPEENVRVIVPDTGSAYGGKHTGECAIEAARIAKGAGKPVKLVWTREEEFTWAYFRPAGVIDIRSEAAKDGTIASWNFDNYNSGPSAIESPYQSTSSQAHFHHTKYPLRQGSYRGLAATANHFARESHIDEIASAIGMDPLAFRLKNLKDDRIRAVLNAAAQHFQWGNKKPATGRGYGIACGTEKGSCFACCAVISVTPDHQIQVNRVVEAFECGAVVNPEHLKNQVEGAIVMGLGGALFEAIDFADGRILNPHLAKYRVPRFSDLPSIEVVLVDRKDLPSAGAGETPIMGIAPAIGNALFQATGVRIRAMPIVPAFQASNKAV
jgi:CO/xanthine dehydrogenase Mo-binding subunit